MLETKPQRLSETEQLQGAGIYAIYILGGPPFYQPIIEKNAGGKFELPIYVGKAIPKGGRRGKLTSDSATGTALRDRLNKHRASIAAAENLDADEFWFRSLRVDDIWIPLGERMLIEKFKPIWNRVIDGFGINAPGKGREAQMKSVWDMLHPGRSYAVRLPPNTVTASDAKKRIDAYFASGTVYTSGDDDDN